MVVVFVWVVGGGILNDAAERLGGSGSGVPCPGLEIGDDTGQQVEELVRVLFLDIGELLGGSVADQGRVAGFEKADAVNQAARYDWRNTYVTRRSSLFMESRVSAVLQPQMLERLQIQG
jgi:hypothetical protein